MQTEESKRPHVIAYASRLLTAVESKYSVTHLEALAVVWALKHFRDIIFGCHITVYTDHIAVNQLFQDAWLDGILLFNSLNQHWSICLAKPTLADALSRNIPGTAVNEIANFSLSELHKAQRQDPMWSKVFYALDSYGD